MKNRIIINEELVVEKPLNAIVSELEAILKPYQHKLMTEIERQNGIPKTIRMKVEINL
jgi:hypothetical protein